MKLQLFGEAYVEANKHFLYETTVAEVMEPVAINVFN